MRVETDTDSHLVAACRRGEMAAFGTIVERYQRAVCAMAYAAVHDRVLAEDIAQDTFVMAWNKLGSLKDSERLPAWLCGIARNLARARGRKDRRETPSEIEIVGGTTPYDALDDRQTETIVAAALARMPEAYREPLVLFYCEDQSATDVGRALDLSDMAVHKRLSRGRQLLAADTQLVEHALGRMARPRRDLAAAVLAAIAIGIGSSSRVEASPKPRPRGRSMLKLAAFAFATTAAVATTYAVKRDVPGRVAAPKSTTRSLAYDAQRAPTLSRTLISAVRIGMGTAKLNHGGNGPSTPTCDEAAHYMAVMALEGQRNLPRPDSVTFEQITDETATHFAKRCEREQWSAEYMTCVLGSTDSFSTVFDCADYASSNISPNGSDAADDGEFTVQTRTLPVPPSSDFSCAGVGKHLAELSLPDEASLAKVPADKREEVAAGVQRARDMMPAQIEKGCVDAGWTEERRRCLSAAETATAMGACL